MGGTALTAPVVGIAPTPDGRGYWLAAADGGVFTFGDARFAGSRAGQSPSDQFFAICATVQGDGYLLTGEHPA